MSNSVVSISTAGLPAPRRTQHWAEALTALCGKLKADPFGARTLDGHIDYTSVGLLRLCQIEVSRHRVSLPAAWAAPGAHQVLKILFQTHGSSVFEQEDRRIELTPGDCLAYDVSRPHIITSEALTKHEVVIIPKEMLRQRGVLLERTRAQKLSARAGAGRLARDFVQSIFNEAAALSDAAEAGVADTLLDLLLLPFAAETLPGFDSTHPDSLVRQAKCFIQEKLSDPDLRIDHVAAALGCTKRHLHTLFSEDGATIGRYIWRARLDNCRHDLTRSKKTVTEVAFSWGFSSSSHFSRLFKKEFGLAPSALRKRHSRSV